MGLIFLLFGLLLLFGGPIAAVAFFIVSLIKFVSGKVKNKRIPYSVSPNKMLVRKTCLIISSIVAGFFIAVFIMIIILNSGAISFM